MLENGNFNMEEFSRERGVRTSILHFMRTKREYGYVGIGMRKFFFFFLLVLFGEEVDCVLDR